MRDRQKIACPGVCGVGVSGNPERAPGTPNLSQDGHGHPGGLPGGDIQTKACCQAAEGDKVLLLAASQLGAVLGLERPRFYIPSFPTLHMISLIRLWVNRDNH